MAASLASIIGQTDIYLLDQIMKGRFAPEHVILDAGCGKGRNLHWFLQGGFQVYGSDMDAAAIESLRKQNPDLPVDRFRVEPLEASSFSDNTFDHVISSAVLHFAQSFEHFFAMFGAMVRILKPGGSLFIRMASDIGIEQKVVPISDGVYYLPDGSTRFLLTRSLLQQIRERFPIGFMEPFKIVNVADLRCMSTLMLQKEQ